MAEIRETSEIGFFSRDFSRGRHEPNEQDDRNHRRRDMDNGRDRRDYRERDRMGDRGDRNRDNSDRDRDRGRDFGRRDEERDRFRNNDRNGRGVRDQKGADYVRGGERPRRTDRHADSDGKSE